MYTAKLWDLLGVSHYKHVHFDFQLCTIHLSKQADVRITDEQYEILKNHESGQKYVDRFRKVGETAAEQVSGQET